MAFRTGYAKKVKQWSSLASGQIFFTTGTTSGVGTIAFGEAKTILRMLGEYTIQATASAAAGDFAIVTVGIGVTSTDAITAGGAALPDPAGEAEYPWLYHASHALIFASNGPDHSPQGASVRHRFDVRSMRKVKPRESLSMIVQYVDGAGAPPITFGTGIIRVLNALS